MKLGVTSLAKACFRFSSLALVVLGLSHLTASAKPASFTFSEDFNGITSAPENHNGTQAGNNTNPLQFGATLTGWTASGGGAIHAVEYFGATGNQAVMIFSGQSGVATPNTIQTTNSFAANDLGTTYVVSYDFSAAVYQDGNQATQAGDGLRFAVLLASNNSIEISGKTETPGAYTGNMSFITGASFSYVGTGTGDVQFLITSATPNNVRFAGAVDNFSVTASASAVPEPSTYAAIFGAVVLGAAVYRRRSARA